MAAAAAATGSSYAPGTNGNGTLAAAKRYSCGVQKGNWLACWGAVPGLSPLSLAAATDCALQADGGLNCDAGNSIAVTTVVAGDYHVCVLRPSGGVVCVGDTADDGQTSVPKILSQALGISARSMLTCAISVTGIARCWGDCQEQRCATPDEGVLQLSVGWYHSCAVMARDSSVRCWGLSEGMRLTAPSGKYLAVAAGEERSCAVTIDHRVECWGSSEPPMPPPPSDLQARDICGGKNFFCALDDAERPRCWGTVDLWTPDGPFSALACGTRHVCALSRNGSVTCWGDDRDGQATPRCTGGLINAPNVCVKHCSPGFAQRDKRCEICAAGTHSNSSGAPCESCPPGFTSTAGSALCEPCPIGMFSDKAGSVLCAACPSGHLCPADGTVAPKVRGVRAAGRLEGLPGWLHSGACFLWVCYR